MLARQDIRRFEVGIVLAVCILLASSAHGEFWHSLEKLTASDGVAGDAFGYAADIYGDIAVIGAVGANSNTGSAYILRYDDPNTTWREEQRLNPSEGAPGDSFGVSVAICNQLAVIGSHHDTTAGGDQAGSAYVFRYDTQTSNWIQEQKLEASDASWRARFGRAVEISGDIIVIGAHTAGNYIGTAYVFQYDQNTSSWIQEQILSAPNSPEHEEFGVSVGIVDDTIMIGARQANDYTGKVYVYRYNDDSSTWDLVQTLLAPDGATGDSFGLNLDMSEYTVLITAIGKQDHGTMSGAAYIFRYDSDSTSWDMEQKLLASDGAENDYFGYTAALSGDVALLGAAPADDYTGSAYLFRYDSDSAIWIEEVKLAPDLLEEGDRFGGDTYVGLDGDHALIGARGDDELAENAGAVYAFEAYECADTLTADLDSNCVVNLEPIRITPE